jgi:hypothetical protein
LTDPRRIAAICTVAIASLAFAASALGQSAGDEYLPKVPESGSQSHAKGGSSDSTSGSGETPTTTLPSGGSSSESTNAGSGGNGQAEKDKKKDKEGKEQRLAPVGSAGGGGGGGDSSDSLLLNPIVLLVIAAVIAVAVGMTLRHRRGDEGDPDTPETKAGARREGTPKTPGGEIAAGPDSSA